MHRISHVRATYLMKRVDINSIRVVMQYIHMSFCRIVLYTYASFYQYFLIAHTVQFTNVTNFIRYRAKLHRNMIFLINGKPIAVL